MGDARADANPSALVGAVDEQQDLSGPRAGECYSEVVTVLIITRDRAELLRDCLFSIAQQWIRPTEVVIVDDGSTDHTTAVIAAVKGLTITYVNKGHLGIPAARNLAVSLCRTKYGCIMDDDDLMLPNRIHDHLAAARPGVQITYGAWIDFKDDYDSLSFHQGGRMTPATVIQTGGVMLHGAAMYETSVLRQFPYAPCFRTGSDFDMNSRMVLAGIRGAHTGSFVLLRRMHGQSVTITDRDFQASVNSIKRRIANMHLTSEEVVAQQAAARALAPVDVQFPSLRPLSALLRRDITSSTVIAAVSRRLDVLAATLDRLAVERQALHLAEPGAVLGSTLWLRSERLASPADIDQTLAVLGSLGTPVALEGQRLQPVTPRPGYDFCIPADSFRLRVRLGQGSISALLERYRQLSERVNWTWYAHIEAGEGAANYCLVSALFKILAGAEEQRRREEMCRRIVKEATGLDGEILRGG